MYSSRAVFCHCLLPSQAICTLCTFQLHIHLVQAIRLDLRLEDQCHMVDHSCKESKEVLDQDSVHHIFHIEMARNLSQKRV